VAGSDQNKGESMKAAADRPTDKFVAMVTARADVDLKLTDFEPRSMLVAPVHLPERPIVDAIDAHNHLDSMQPHEVLAIMDRCGIERVLNITMQVGERAIEVLHRYQSASPDRFATMAWMDWTGIEGAGFWTTLTDHFEKMVELGACGLKLWKDLGLTVRDSTGALLRIDDERLVPLFEKAAELDVPIMFHTADPDAFFKPIDRYNERYEELAAHPDWGFAEAEVKKDDLLAQRDRVFARHPKTRFIAAHIAESGENLARVMQMLDRHQNVCVDMSARVAELGRQPYRSREFFMQYQDRILFGTDLLPSDEMYRLHYRFLETFDEYFDYPSHASRQGRWQIYGIGLPKDVLVKLYRTNAQRVFGWM
jgi:predicted TIM-barrel fold metal-dependent hydrolase